jgi:hypothetical protein
MIREQLALWTRRALLVAASAVAAGTALTAEAQASCFTNAGKHLLSSRVPYADGFAMHVGDEQDRSIGPIGLWNAEFLIGNGPDLFDESFQQFHADGTEMMLSRGLPPALGNVCIGIWKQDGPRTVRLKHMAWNWDADGRFIGTFVMDATLRLDRRSGRYTGTWSADNFDTAGNVIPDQHVEGIVRARRITFD